MALIALFAAAVVSACGGDVVPEAKYKPPVLPVALVISPDGIAIEGDASLVTPIGVFSVGAQYELPPRASDSMYVIVRDRKRGGTGFDDIYQLKTGDDQFSAVVNGLTLIEVKDRTVLIDVTDGKVNKIEFKRVESNLPQVQEGVAATWWDKAGTKWDEGWKSSFYRPFALSRWAYDDSTIDKWWGLGFAWFLLRLFLALLLACFDVFLTMIFLVAQVAYVFWGSTGRNIAWGVAVLSVLLGAAAADSRTSPG